MIEEKKKYRQLDKKVYKVMLSDEFNKILNADPIMRKLNDERYSKVDDYFSICSVLNRNFYFSGMKINPLTPAIFSLLFLIESPYIPGCSKGKKITDLDTDIFMYLLTHKLDTETNKNETWLSKSVDKVLRLLRLKEEKKLIGNITSIDTLAMGFCKKNKLDYLETEKDIKFLIYTSFASLFFLPSRGKKGEGEKIRYDADWLAWVVATVSKVSNYSPDYIKFEMSLCEANFYILQFLKLDKEVTGIRAKTDEEVNSALMERTLDLGQLYYDSLMQKKQNSKD